jgi:predicted permease
MDALLQDLRHAVRSLLRRPAFAWTTVLILALGVGAATSGFTLLNWVLLRPLPGISDPGTLGLVWFAARTPEGYFSPGHVTTAQREGILRTSPAVARLAGHEDIQALNISLGNDQPVRRSADFVSPGFLPTLGARTDLGRGLAPDDDSPGVPRNVVVISDDLWRGMFGGRPDAIGRTIHLNAVPFTVIGVMARGFHGVERLNKVDLWLPGGTYWDVKHVRPSTRPAELSYYEFALRLRPGATFPEAERQLAASAHLLAVGDTANFDSTFTATVFPGLGLPAMGRDILGHQLTLVMGISALMLLVVCANVANLLLLHRARNRGEVVVRMMLGANRGRVIRHFLLESVMLGVAGAGAGTLLALWLVQTLHDLPVMGRLSLEGIAPDWRVLAAAGVIGIGAALLAGVVPALLGSRSDFNSELRSTGPTATRSAPVLRSGLAAAQVAVALTLVAGAYLFARTLQHFTAMPLGFDPAGVTIFADDPEQQGYTPERAQAYRRQLAERVAGIPGVEHVAFVSIPPFTGISMGAALRLPGAPPDARPQLATADQVSSGYFTAMGIPLVRGSGFDAGDDWRPLAPGATGKLILSVGLARKLFGTDAAVGRLVSIYGRTDPVVGEVGDIHWNGRGGDGEPMLYEPIGDKTPYAPMLVVKARAPTGAVERAVAHEAAALDATLPIVSRGPLITKIADSLADRTLLFRLLSILSLLTLALAAVGVYSLVAYGVATRTREFGIRMALGAGARQIIRASAGAAVGIITAGVVGGVVATLYLTRFIAASLYGVSPLDPVAIVSAAAVLASAALLASYLPARRATRIDPMVALRAE